MDKPAESPKNIVWDAGKLTAEVREKKLGQRGAVLWFTGLSGSGKSTIAREVEWALVQQGTNAYVLDGDNVRHGLNADLSFSAKDRTENIRRIGEVAKLFADANVICLAAFVSPYRADRMQVRALLPPNRFIEIYCAASLAACEARDVKGLYKKARSAEIPDFTGISAPYEPPDKPELTLQTGGQEPVEASVKKVLNLLAEKGFLTREK
jgi:adenylylsulfate kinase